MTLVRKLGPPLLIRRAIRPVQSLLTGDNPEKNIGVFRYTGTVGSLLLHVTPLPAPPFSINTSLRNLHL